jgi:hypothetical protein
VAQELHWLDHIGGSIEEGIAVANRMQWSISIKSVPRGWLVMGGDQTIYFSDSYEGVEAFLYGLALAYAVLPEWLLTPLEEAAAKFTE